MTLYIMYSACIHTPNEGSLIQRNICDFPLVYVQCSIHTYTSVPTRSNDIQLFFTNFCGIRARLKDLAIVFTNSSDKRLRDLAIELVEPPKQRH